MNLKGIGHALQEVELEWQEDEFTELQLKDLAFILDLDNRKISPMQQNRQDNLMHSV